MPPNTTTALDAFLETLTLSIKNHRYFVDWEKIEGQKREHELHLHMLNYVLGKPDIKKELRYLIKREPSIVQVFPILMATREQTIEVFDKNQSGSKSHQLYTFLPSSVQSDKEIDELLFFLEQTGVIALMENNQIRSFSDYVFGIEVGMDTHGRKNRGGLLMENLVEEYIEKETDITYIKQVSYAKLQRNFGLELHPSLQRRIFDFVIRKGDEWLFVETNFFNEGGTKLKSVVGEFKQLQRDFRRHHPEHHLIWVTDGKGWMKTKQPLKEALEEMDTILNISMLEKGAFASHL